MKKAEILGILHFSQNFSKSLPTFVKDKRSYSEEMFLQITLDNTDTLKITDVRKKIYDTFRRLMRGIMIDCERSKNAGRIPVNIEELYEEKETFMMKAFGLGFVIP